MQGVVADPAKASLKMSPPVPGAERPLAFIRNIIEATGPRFSGSLEERRAAELVGKAFEDATGSRAAIEPFTCHPHSTVASIPLLGCALLLVVTPLYFISPLAAAAAAAFVALFAVTQIFRFSTAFDFLFPRRTSQNVYSVVEPSGGQVDFSLVLGAHLDSMWGWGLALKNPTLMWVKVPWGIAGGVAALVFSIVRHLQARGTIGWAGIWTDWAMLLFLPGFWYLTRFLSWNRKNGSPGAMDNLSGIAVGLEIARHYRENPEDAPRNCRIILAAFGAEECGLRGSRAFVQRHRRDLLANAWVLNIDSISDFSYFHVVDGDTWLGTRYDEDFCRLAQEAMQEADAVPATRIRNPVGGSDGASFSRQGIRAVTLIAQKPAATDYYHTHKDRPERLDPAALEKMKEVCLRLVAKVDSFVHRHPQAMAF